MEIAIRRAVADDLASLAALARKTYVDAFGHSFRAPDLKAHLEKNLSDDRFSRFLQEDVILVAERQGEMIGFAQIGAAKPDHFDFAIARGDQELRRIYVLKDDQRKGVGGALIDAALQLPASVAALRIFLDVWEENIAARRFYERRDFKTCGKRAFVTDSGIATGFELIMVRQRRAKP
jgi:ribosomal protein S18 acetylase RimI-like enzyme